MSQDLEKVRNEVATLLSKSTDGMSAEDLDRLIKDSIAAELATRKASHGGGSTLTLNALLNLEIVMKTKVFKLRHVAIPDLSY